RGSRARSCARRPARRGPRGCGRGLSRRGRSLAPMVDAASELRAPKPVGIVPHTHWDREWYAPFQRYRVQLVHLVDDLLDLLEADPSFTRFLLDGQTAVIDDYVEVRPEAEPRLRALVAAGRLQVGPWMILMDE